MPDQRGIRLQQRNRLALHVRAHQGPVGVVVLQEGDQRGRNRDDLLGRDVHVVDFLGRHRVDLATVATDHHPIVAKTAIVTQRRVGLGDDVTLLFDRSQIVDLVGNPARFDSPIRSLDEPVPVDPGISGERADQSDVRTFWGLDRTHAAVVRRMNVTNLEPGPLAREATWTERRQPAPMGEPGQRVGLVHELAELARAEELFDRSRDRADVDQALGSDRIRVLGGHPLLDDPLESREPDPHLVLDELADRSDAAIPEVIDVVDRHRDLDPTMSGHRRLLVVKRHQILDRVEDVLVAQHLGVDRECRR